jgi:hypothetical protein
MGGCAVELDSARRAHLGAEQLAYEGFDPAGGRTGERRVYNGLCAAFGRQLVLDILTGASAGGINGALLGASMSAQRRLHPKFVRGRWLELGDFSRLLHETTESAPRSLMQGDLFHEDLLEAFEAVLGNGGEEDDLKAGALPEGQRDLEPLIAKLDVTMTDVVGTERVFRDEWDGDLVAREHQVRFKFRELVDYTAEQLAAAARTSASFPIAFEPWSVEDGAATLAGLDGQTYGVDGGLLDNAPIRAALDLIPGQRASTRVRRYVCYLNADPPQVSGAKADDSKAPSLKDVVGYTINLPRVAPFVNQLYAVEEATRRADLTPLIQNPLLGLELSTLRDTAAALLEAYRRRRTILSLEELLDEPADAARVAESLAIWNARLPWLPADLEPPDSGPEWSWGVRPAQRVLHLLLDLLRPALNDDRGDGQAFAAREAIDRQLDELEAIQRATAANRAIDGALRQLISERGNPAAVTDGLWELTEPERIATFSRVEGGADAFRKFLLQRGEGRGEGEGEDRDPMAGLYELLFTETEPEREWSWLQCFLARALALEVVRRALAADADVETAQALRFVQMTPSAPTPILTADPLAGAAKATTAHDKLTGVGLGHFAGFYRGSWRANDYMWGRLDAASRIVEMLLDGARTSSADEAAAILATAVLPPDAPEAARWLAHEALEAKLGDDYLLRGDDVPDAATLHPLLAAEIADELLAAEEESHGDGLTGLGIEYLPFTRAVCTRAVQLEIMQDELPVLVEQSAADSERGSSSPALELPLEQGMRATIAALRKQAEEGEPLSRRLDDSHEEVSDLGLRTITHSAFVGLSAARAAGAPLSKFFGIVRAPLQAISGSVSYSLLYRCTVALAFWAAALYLTMRFATAQGAQDTALSDVWSRAVLVSLIAALAVLAVALVPGLRAWRDVGRARNGLLALGLVGAGGAAAALLACYAGDDLGFANVLFGTGSEQLPDWLLSIVLVVSVGLSAVRLPIVGKLAGEFLKSLRNGWQLCLPLIVVSAVTVALSAWRVAPLLGDSWWQTVSAILALFVAPLLVAGYLATPLAITNVRRLVAGLGTRD